MSGSQIVGALRADAKRLGAYYTDEVVASFLVRWAVRAPADRVLDPSFGGGVFLRAAAAHLAEIGGHPATQVFGVEFDRQTYRAVAGELADAYGITELRHADFFDVGANARQKTAKLPPVDAVVGNPPFIRYQRFSGTARANAIRRAAEAGVTVPELTSSWAPFVVHSVSLLRDAGRLAMVMPYEITYATYARPVLRFLASRFEQVLVLVFREKLFPQLSEATVLVLASGKRAAANGRVLLRHLGSAADLANGLFEDSGGDEDEIDVDAVASGAERFTLYHLPARTRELYRRLKEISEPLGAFADVGIGYVTGANEFFHPTPDTISRLRLPPRNLARTVTRARALRGTRFREEDWRDGVASGTAGYLLLIDPDDPLTPELSAYLRKGKRSGIPDRYKCRTRKPWYAVPHVHRPDAFMTYMNGGAPRCVANEAGAFAPNTLHVLRLRDGEISARAVAALWQTSLTALSTEIEGHALGGGMLKLEPREAARVRIPRHGPGIEELCLELDEVLRSHGAEEAAALADREVLAKLGVSRRELAELRSAAAALRARRCFRIAPDGVA